MGPAEFVRGAGPLILRRARGEIRIESAIGVFRGCIFMMKIGKINDKKINRQEILKRMKISCKGGERRSISYSSSEEKDELDRTGQKVNAIFLTQNP